MDNITIEIVENNITTIGKFRSIQQANAWISNRQQEKRFNEIDLKNAFEAGRIPTLNRAKFSPISDFHFMSFNDYIK